MDDRYTVLVLGGYGVFGRRICRLLARDRSFRVIVGGRSIDKARSLAEELTHDGADTDVAFAHVSLPDGLSNALNDSDARLVIHTAGPFQGQDYRVPETCIENGVHYVDIADDRAFVSGFAALDAAARTKGVSAVSGASSVPGLSSAVVARLVREVRFLRRISIGISTGNRAPRGVAVLAAILSYTGKPIPRWQDGRWIEVIGWQDLGRRAIGAGSLGSIGTRWFAACDVPDTVLLPERYPSVDTVTFHAGLELPLLHLGLWGLSWAVRWRLSPSLQPYAPILRHIATWFDRFGTDRGGMFVEVEGEGADGIPLTRTWTLVAGAGEGPWVPCVPAVVLAKKIARRKTGLLGAQACLGLFDLDEFGAEIQNLHIGFEIDRPDPAN